MVKSFAGFLFLLMAPRSLMSNMFFVRGDESRPWTPEGYDDDEYPPAPPSDVDVVIVGGGFSGLTAAYDLQKAGLTTVVLEAKHVIGGKSRSQKREKGLGYLEMGATWINEFTQPNVYQLTQEFGLEVVEQYTDGQVIFQDTDGTVNWNDQGGEPSVCYLPPNRQLASGTLLTCSSLRNLLSYSLSRQALPSLITLSLTSSLWKRT
jgi:flavin-dependent amine oxidoreductase